jgi:hypothetical protein
VNRPARRGWGFVRAAAEEEANEGERHFD